MSQYVGDSTLKEETLNSKLTDIVDAVFVAVGIYV